MKALIFIMKFLAATALLCVTGFCGFGFLASFEVGPISLWHGLYAAFGIGTCAVALRLLLQPTLGETLGTLALFAIIIVGLSGVVGMWVASGFPWQVVGGGALICGCLTAGIAGLRRWGDRRKPLCPLALFGATVYCGLGFMESYHGFPWPWWVGYGALGCGCLAGGIACLRLRAGGKLPGLDQPPEHSRRVLTNHTQP